MAQTTDSSWRFWKVNSLSHKDAYLLPQIDQTLDSLAGAKYFSTYGRFGIRVLASVNGGTGQREDSLFNLLWPL